VPELSDALEKWLAVLGLGRVTFVANSFGCQVVADLAARHPERVDRLVFIGPTVDQRWKTIAAGRETRSSPARGPRGSPRDHGGDSGSPARGALQ